MTKKEPEIDDDLMNAIAEESVTYEPGTAGEVAAAMLKEAGKRHAAAVAQANFAQQMLNKSRADALKADADREAAAKLLTSLHRMEQAKLPVVADIDPPT